MNNHKNNNGFTLIELMVTIAIVGVFASIALPSFSSLIESNRISTATNELVSNLLFARSEALKRRNNVTICPSVTQHLDNASCAASSDFSTGWIVFLDCDANGVRDLGTIADCGENDEEEIIKIGDAFSSIYMTNQSATQVSFGFSGRISGVPSNLEIGADTTDRRKKVIVSRVGRVRSCIISESGC